MDDERQDSPEQEAQDDRQRLAQLEQEVARLRSRLGPDPAAQAEAPELDQDLPTGPPDAEAAALLDRLQPSRARAIIIALVMGLLALGVILGLTVALTDWLDSAAQTAARSLVPEDVADTAAESSGAARKPAPAPPPAPAPTPKQPRAPGL
jgi:hypothetical protein